jgi:hypothetical protein
VAHKGLFNQKVNKREFNSVEGFLVQRNHYDEDGPSAKQNKYDPSKRPVGNPSTIDLEESSGERRRAMTKILKPIIAQRSLDLDALAEDALSKPPVQNGFTVPKERVFKQEGLEAEIIRPNVNVGMAALLSGNIDYVTLFSSVVRAAIQGVPVRVLSATVDKPNQTIISAAGFKTIKDLKGKRIAVGARNLAG